MIPKHCTDERLLAWLDGEQNVVSAALTRRHLQVCWECRSRMARLEAAAHGLSQARGHSRFLGADRVEAARVRVLQRMESRRGAAASPLWRRAPAYPLLGSLCLAGAVGLWETYRPADRAAPPRMAATAVKKLPEAVVAPPAVARLTPRPAPSVHASPPLERRLEVVDPVPSDAETAHVWVVLHEMGLCRERAVRLLEEGGALRLTGVVASAETRERMAARLQEAGIAVDIAVTSLDAIAPPQTTPGVEERVVRVEAPGERLLMASLQEQGLSHRDAAARSGEIANASVMASDLAWSEAWALRDLAGRFGPRWQHLPEPARAMVLAMARDHWSELQTLAARQRRLIGGILPTSHSPGGDWFAAIEAWVQAAQDLFAPARPVEADARMLAMRIASALVAIEALAGDDGALAALLISRRPQMAKVRD